jgi:hypothetical protein
MGNLERPKRITLFSDRQHDAFDNPAKMACREGTLRALREAAYRWWDRIVTINGKRDQS